MFAAGVRMKNVTCFQADAALLAVFADFHFDDPIHYREYFFAVVNVPFVRLVGPVR